MSTTHTAFVVASLALCSFVTVQRSDSDGVADESGSFVAAGAVAVQDSSLSIALDTNPVYWAYPQMESIRLETPGGAVVRPQPGKDDYVIVFNGLGPGAHTLRIDDPAFEPLIMTGLEPGAKKVRARLLGSSAIELKVLDGERNHQPVESYDMTLRMENGTFPVEQQPWCLRSVQLPTVVGYASEFEVHSSSSPPPANHVYRGIPPGSYTLIVAVADRATEYVSVADLKPHETRKLEVTVRMGGSVRGRLVDDTGAPASGELIVLPEDEVNAISIGHRIIGREPTAFERWVYLGHGRARAKCTAGDDGSFQIERLSPGRYVIKAESMLRRLGGLSQPFVIEDHRETQVSIALSALPDPFAEMNK